MWRISRLQLIMDGPQSAIAVVPRHADKVSSFRTPCLSLRTACQQTIGFARNCFNAAVSNTAVRHHSASCRPSNSLQTSATFWL